jgi:hypothetical protein
MSVIWMYTHVDSFVQLHLFCIGACTGVVLLVLLHAGFAAVLDFLTATREIQYSEMVAALASAFIVLGKNEALIFSFCLNHKVAILTAKNFLNFSVKILQSFPNSLNFVSGNATRFEFGPDEFIKLFGGELLFCKPQSGFPALWNFLFLPCQVDQML